MIIQPNGIFTNQNSSRKMRRIKFSGTERYKVIIHSQPKTKPSVKKKKKISHLVYFAIPVDRSGKMKKSKKFKYLGLSENWNFYGTWRWRLCVWTSSLKLGKERGSVRIPRRVLETWGDLLLFRRQRKTTT